MRDPVPDWTLRNFVESFDTWARMENPSPDIGVIVADWIFTRLDDPYRGARREPDFPSLWFGPVPGTSDGRTVVTCSYLILELERIVRCDSFATLNLPI